MFWLLRRIWRFLGHVYQRDTRETAFHDCPKCQSGDVDGYSDSSDPDDDADPYYSHESGEDEALSAEYFLGEQVREEDHPFNFERSE